MNEKAQIITVNELRSDYRRHRKSTQDKNELMGYYIVRPLSFYPTAVFMNIGLTANQTTWISLIVLLVGCFLLAVGNYLTALAGAALLNIWLVLDFVDGNIARYEKTCSRYGEFIDAMGAYLAHLSFFAAGVGFYVSRNSLLLSSFEWPVEEYSAVILILGSIASLAAIWIRLIFQKFKNTFPDLNFEKSEILSVRSTASISAVLLNLGHNLVNLSGLLLPVFFLAAAFRLLDVFLIFVAIANTSVVAITLFRVLTLAKELDALDDAE
jgi:phosphatidylglycerophosphate synthase